MIFAPSKPLNFVDEAVLHLPKNRLVVGETDVGMGVVDKIDGFEMHGDLLDGFVKSQFITAAEAETGNLSHVCFNLSRVHVFEFQS